MKPFAYACLGIVWVFSLLAMPTHDASAGDLPLSTVPAVVAPAGATLYVDASAVSDGDGSSALPFRNLNVGLSAIQGSGGTLVLNSGTYPGPISILNSSKDILIKAASGASPVISCSAPQSGWTLHSGAIYKTKPAAPVTQVFFNGAFLQRSRYPTSGFLSVGSDSPTVSAPSQNLTIRPTQADGAVFASKDLKGATVTLRVIDFAFNSSVIQSYDGSANVLNLNPAPAGSLASECYPKCSLSFKSATGWGYFLENKLWMMTKGSWVYDSSSNDLYVWLPDNSVPSKDSVQVAVDQDCITVTGSQRVTFQGVTIANSGKNGIALSNSPNTRWNKVAVKNIRRIGLKSSSSDPLIIDQSMLYKTGSDAIYGTFSGVQPPSTATIIESNWIGDSGIALGPMFTNAAVYYFSTYRTTSRIKNNWLSRTGYSGIFSGAGSRVEGNTVEKFCLYTDDGAAIYTNGYTAPGTVIYGNILRNATSNQTGKPVSRGAYPVAGVYLDDYSSDFRVESNITMQTDIGIMLHNAQNSVVNGNRFTEFSRAGVFAQEDSIAKHLDLKTSQMVDSLDANGNTYPSMSKNSFNGNLFVDTQNASTVWQISYLSPGFDRLLASYSGSGNVYYSLYNEVLVNGASDKYTFNDLKTLGLDSNPYRVFPTTFKQWTTVSTGLSAFTANSSNLQKFTSYSSAGTATLTSIPCPIASNTGSCIGMIASPTGKSTLTSPTFAMSVNHFYKVKVQAMSGDSASPLVHASVLQNAAPWGSVDGLKQSIDFQVFPGKWKIYEFYVQSNTDLTNARVDLGIPAGRNVILGDLQVSEVTTAPSLSTEHYLGFLNLDYKAPSSFPCPDSGAASCDAWTTLSLSTVTFQVSADPRTLKSICHP